IMYPSRKEKYFLSARVLYTGKATSERGNLQVTLPHTRPSEVVPRQPVGMEYAWDVDKLV
ncbi:hypothetical protein KI387_009715, partial [Taxus chinensis]